MSPNQALVSLATPPRNREHQMVSPPDASEPAAPQGIGWFATTHWSVVLAARRGDSPQSLAALETLCRTYWPPLFAYLRRAGHSDADAKDLTQAFFARLLERDYLSRLQHQEGKFRFFLLTFLKHFLQEEVSRAKTKKRGGDRIFISLDAFTDEERRPFESVDPLTPDQAYERRWAQLILEQAAQRLREEYEARGKRVLFEALQDAHLGEQNEAGYQDLGARLGMSESAVKSAVVRMRRRHREILREEIAQTVSQTKEIDEEVRHFLAILR